MNRVLITGASSGIGAGLARAYAKPGATLGLLARRGDKLREVAAEIEAQGARSFIREVDVRDTAATADAVHAFAREAGGLDIAIANAGIGEGRKGERFDAAKVARVFEVNVIGTTNTLLPALEVMRTQNSGTLVGMASVAAYRALPGSLAYSAAKGAVKTLMEGLEMELSETQISAVCLCPGFIRTPLTDKNEFSMPFRLECDEACRRMKKAIDARQARFTFPLPMAAVAQLLRVAPQWLLLRSSPESPQKKG